MVITCTQYILTVVVCVWYFTSNSDARGKTSLGTGFRWLFRYNFGSVAFGSFLLALIWFIIIVFEYMQKKIEKANQLAGQPTAFVRCIVNCCRCCLQCCHRFIKFLNKNAYVQIALHGKNFCTSAINGFLLVMKNKGTFFITEGLGGVFMFLGKVVITMGNTLIGYVIITQWPKISDKINSPLAPLMIVLILSYVVASLFMSLYSTASISILQCFLTDVELSRNPGDDLDG